MKIKLFLLPPSILKIKNCRLLAEPGWLGINGGFFNPGALADNGEIVMLARGENEIYPQIKDAEKFLLSYHPILMFVNEELKIHYFHQLTVNNFPTQWRGRIDDSRIFKFRNQVYVNSNYCMWPEGKKFYTFTVISNLNIRKSMLYFLGVPTIDYPLKRSEKNWVYFELNNELYLIYSFSPYILLKASDWPALTFKTVMQKKIIFPFEFYDNFIALSTNPIDYDVNHLLLVVHKRRIDWPRSYVFWAVLINKKTLIPTQVSSRPLIKSGQSRGFYKGHVYLSAVVSLNHRLIFFLGEGDSHLSGVSIDKEHLNSFFIPL